MVRALQHAERQQEEDRAAMRRALEDAERRHRAAAAERESHASYELRELSAKVQAVAAAEVRAQDDEKTMAEEAARAVPGGK